MFALTQLITFLGRSAPQGRGYRGLLGLALTGGLLAGLASTALIAVINRALADPAARSGRWLWIFLGLCAVLPLARLLANAVLVRLTQRSRVAVEVELCRNILRTPLQKLEELGKPRLYATLTEDVDMIVFMLGNLPVLLMHVSFLLASLVYLSFLSWKVFALLCLCLAVGIVTYLLPTQVAQRHLRQARDLSDQTFANFRHLTDGIKELKMHRSRREAFLSRRLVPTTEQQGAHRIRGLTIFTFAASWGQLIFFLVIGALVFGLSWDGAHSTATLSGYVLIILYMLGPLDVVLNQVPNLQAAKISLDRLDELGLALRESARDEGSGQPPAAWSRLELVGISHRYHNEGEDRAFLLGPLDLHLERGECLFVVGGNGSGKTTLAKVLVGLYAPEAGQIRLDGEVITEQRREELRALFSVVFSDFHLFDELLGLTPAGGEAELYLRRLQLERKVHVEQGALSTLELSQGQRKRLALLTAYLEDRAIYLFDEWAADQDPAFKEIFYRELLPGLKARGKTVVVISHDDRYFSQADRILKLEAGQIATTWVPTAGLENAVAV